MNASTAGATPRATSVGAALQVRDLSVRFGTRHGMATVVDGVSWQVDRGETLAVVGESGSGKSVTALAVMGLLPAPPARITGEVIMDGQNLLMLPEAQRRTTRGAKVALVFQDPMTSLNPYLTIGRQIGEGLAQHLGLTGEAQRARAAELLAMVGIPAPRERLGDYPHQFSGGMRQRVMIAIALACEPAVLIADEATTALDVTTQAQITDLLATLQADLGMALVWITHDLGVVAGIADRVVVMYAGQVVEQAAVDDLYADPRHPYTQGLLGSLPVIGGGRRDLSVIPGLPPDPLRMPLGCRFWPRCSRRADPRCEGEQPPLREVAPGHLVRSFYDAGRDGAATPGAGS